MINLHAKHLQAEIGQFNTSMSDKAEKMVDKSVLKQKLVDKWSIKPTLAEKLVDILIFINNKNTVRTEIVVDQFGLAPTTAKRYLRQLTEFGYLESIGGNKNRSYRMKAQKGESV